MGDETGTRDLYIVGHNGLPVVYTPENIVGALVNEIDTVVAPVGPKNTQSPG